MSEDLAGVSFRVWWDGSRWCAEGEDDDWVYPEGHGSTPPIAIINAEVKTRKAMKEDARKRRAH